MSSKKSSQPSHPPSLPSQPSASTASHSQPSTQVTIQHCHSSSRSSSPPPPYPSRTEALVEPLHRPATYLKRAGIAAWYPIRGIWYFLRHREFYPLFLGRLLPLSILSLLVYFILFAFTYFPQVAFLAFWQGWSAWLNAAFLVLGEGLVIIQGLFEGFFVDETRVDVFDATLLNHGLSGLLAPHRILFADAPNSVRKLGKPITPAAYQPWSLIQIVELIVFLPLNFVPVVGVPAFLIITGARLGKLSHHRYFALMGLDKDGIKKEMRGRVWEYIWFGTVAMLLELIPVLSFFFLLTTTTGSAMWAARLEEEKKRVEGERDAGVQGEYHDDPV